MGIFLCILVSLCLATILLESIPVLFVRNKGAWLRAGLICNVVTNPILNLLMFLMTTYVQNDGLVTAAMLLLEGAVVLIEACFYRKMLDKSRISCFGFALIANALSFGTGMFFFSL